jgi:hypothetical protein
MERALKDFRAAIIKIRKIYRARGVPLYWIRNIEKGTKGAWHIHLVIKQTPEGDAAAIVTKAWTKGGTYVAKIRNSKFTGDDMEQLANYLTKDKHTAETKADRVNQGLRSHHTIPAAICPSRSPKRTSWFDGSRRSSHPRDIT